LTEKKRAHYPLKTILALIETGDLTITGSARASALADFGYDAPQIVATIRRLKESHLYKSMTSHRDHRLWQDVYRTEV